MSTPTTPTPRPTFTITLRPLPPRPGENDPARRLAMLLKAARRAYGFQALDATEAPEAPLGDPDAPLGDPEAPAPPTPPPDKVSGSFPGPSPQCE